MASLIGHKLRVGKYTATCQKNTSYGDIFMLDQYLDKPYRMNSNNNNDDGYVKSLLRVELNKDFASDYNFDAIRGNLLPVFESDLVRIPTVGEFFGSDDFYKMDDAKQWELMKGRHNRIANREGKKCEFGWLQNRIKQHAAIFAVVTGHGNAYYNRALDSIGVRPVFMMKKDTV